MGPFYHQKRLVSKPSLTSQPVSFAMSRRFDPRLDVAVQQLLEKRAMERVSIPDSPGFYSHLFLVPKKDGTFRPVLNVSALNKFVLLESFRLETPRTIRNAIQLEDWAVSIDLKDAYLHVPIHPSSRKLLRFVVNGNIYQFRVLPFGLSTAPRVFTIAVFW